MLSEQERENEFKINTCPNFNAQGDITSHTLVHNEACKYDFFGGLTFFEFIDKREIEIVINEPPAIYRGYDFLPNYTYGLGLRMVVDAPYLSQQVIEDAIADFRERGEREWHSSEAIFFPRGLPK